jgi:predicted GTPase
MTTDKSAEDAGAVLAALAPAFAGTAGALGELRLALERAPERLRMPVRLAVVGQIKKGKSTLVNAILGRGPVASEQAGE